MKTQFCGPYPRGTQVAPLSVEVNNWPPPTAATSLLPLAEEAIALQVLALSRGVHVTPLSVEV
ncbi:MAG: hypothetical protein IPI73_17925 [Betaproteobacteria bacterium]|nr:hypothetical protein [Betaproteobacteria bacterium]